MQCIRLQQGTKIRYHWFSVLGFRISFCNKGLLCYQISLYMSKQKTLTCSKTRKCLVNLREKGKRSECVTPVTLLFSAGSLQLLSNCKVHSIPTCFQGFDFRSFSCSTSMFIAMRHRSHIQYKQYCFGFVVLKSGRNLDLCICHPNVYVQETSYSKAKYLERYYSQTVVYVTNIISCGFQT